MLTDRKIKNITKKLYAFHKIEELPEISIKSVKRGRASIKTNKASVPLWALERGMEYGMYYVVHELVHLIENTKYGFSNHGTRFQSLEDESLELFGLKIERIKNGVYPKKLLSLKGKIFWKN